MKILDATLVLAGKDHQANRHQANYQSYRFTNQAYQHRLDSTKDRNRFGQNKMRTGTFN